MKFELLPSFFEKNRQKFAKLLDSESFACFFSKDENIKGDSTFFPDFNSNLFYLSGIKDINSVLIIFKDLKKTEFFLFIEKQDEKNKIWEGEKINIKEAKKISKISNVFFTCDFEKIFYGLKKKSKFFYSEENFDFLKIKIKKIIPKFKDNFLKKNNIRNPNEILRTIRMIKTKEEIKLIKKTISVTKKAFIAIKKEIPNLKYEKEIEAILSYVYTKNFCSHSYHPIVANQKNACTLHYVKNNSHLKNNSLTLVDSGAEFLCYKSDITRVFKIGQLNDFEIQVYNAVLKVQKKIVKLCKPKKTFQSIEIECCKLLEKECLKLKILTKKDIEKNSNAIRKFYPHSFGHFLGLDTHDLGDYKSPLKEGMVITVEPGLYIKNRKVSVRIEDNILITKSGCVNLSKGISKKLV